MGFPRQEHWSGVPFPSPGDLPDLGVEPESPALAGRFFTTEPPGKLTLTYILTILGKLVSETWQVVLKHFSNT